jgi:hypothetical protein
MAPRVSAKTPTEEARIIGKDEFKRLLKKLKNAESEISQAKGVMGSAVENAVAKQNLHADALRVFRKYERKSPTAAAEFMLHLTVYWEHGNLGDADTDLVETTAERKKNIVSPKAQEKINAGTHIIKGGKVVPLKDEPEEKEAEAA